MPLRLVLILTLLVQQLALPAVGSSSGQVAACLEASCCLVVETETCCGGVVREMRCGKTGGSVCLCGLEPGDPEPTPEAPRPSERQELAPIVAALLGSAIDLPTTVASQAPPAALAIVRSHNETQALLCIWRT
jgi:hypothetical protein